EHLLARLIELVHRPGFPEACSQLARSVGGRLRLGQKGNELTCGNRAIVSAPRLVRHAERLFSSAKLRLMKAFCRERGACRQSRERYEIGDDVHRALERGARLDAARRKRWIWRKALSDPFSIGDGELVIGCLQTTVVEQRDLDRRIGG